MSDSESSSDDVENEPLFFGVRSRQHSGTPVEQDIVQARCSELRKRMRLRPCLPLKDDGQCLSYADVASGMKLPIYSCPYEHCCFQSDNRCVFLHHVAGGIPPLYD